MSMGPGAFRANAPALDVPAVERDLARIPAVSSARVIVEDDQLSEVHVVCGPGRSPKLINRDVQSLLAARWGVDIDHRKVSVVQLSDEEIDLTGDAPADEPGGEASTETEAAIETATETATPSAAPAASRKATAAPSSSTIPAHPRVVELAVSVSEDQCEATVTVALGDRNATGRATSIPTSDGQRRAAAGATLVALTNLDTALTSFGVSDVAAIPLGGARAIVTTISGWRDGSERTTIGAATIGALGELRAAADSVLRAIS